MSPWDLKPFTELDTALLLLLIALLTLPIFFNLFSQPALPGPSILHNFPKGEVYPMLSDSRTTLRTLTNLYRKYGEIFKVWIGPRRFVVSANPADIAQILSTDQFVRPRAMINMFDTVVPTGFFRMPKDLHIATRKKLKTTFNSSMLAGCHTYLTDAVKELCEELEAFAKRDTTDAAGKAIDVSPLLGNTTFRVIQSIAFGCDMSVEKRRQVYGCVEQLIDEMFKDVLGYPFRQALTPLGIRQPLFNARADIYDVCNAFISKRRAETPSEKAARPPDALDAILALGQDDTSIKSQVIELAIAGSHTTSHALSWIIYELCCNPHVEGKVLAAVDAIAASKPLSEPLGMSDIQDLHYLHKVWKENNRRHPPGGFIMRETNDEIALRGSGVKLSKGMHVIAFLQGAHNSNDIWTDAEKFVPERWGDGEDVGEGDSVPLGAYVPFSMGPRNCVGRFLADYEGALVLAELYRRFRFRLACHPREIVSCTAWVECPRFVNDGAFNIGVPVEVELRWQDE